MQEELSRLSTKGTRVIAQKSGHYIQDDRPCFDNDIVLKVLSQPRQSISVNLSN
jgi:hypothetical protein